MLDAFGPLCLSTIVGEKHMLEDLGKKKASELLLKACYLPFVAVGGMTVVFYDISRLEKHPLEVFLVVVTVLHSALLAFWFLVFRRTMTGMLAEMSFSSAAANA